MLGVSLISFSGNTIINVHMWIHLDECYTMYSVLKITFSAALTLVRRGHIYVLQTLSSLIKDYHSDFNKKNCYL